MEASAVKSSFHNNKLTKTERIANTMAFEAFFVVKASSKFGGLKRRSQMQTKVSDMQLDYDDEFLTDIPLTITKEL